jgi:hypothetical protein
MGRFFGSGDCPVYTVGFAYLEVRPKPRDWRYQKPQSPSFGHGTHLLGLCNRWRLRFVVVVHQSLRATLSDRVYPRT